MGKQSADGKDFCWSGLSLPCVHSCTSLMASRAFQNFNLAQSLPRSALHTVVSHSAIDGTCSKDLASLPESHRISVEFVFTIS